MNSIRLFVDVARYRSFSEAAREHGITQSAVSQRIGALERRLGVTLIDRSVRPLALTPAGLRYEQGCLDLLQRYDQLEAQVAGARRGASKAQIVVDAIYSAGIDLLNQLRDQFEDRHPHVSVVIDYKRPEEVHEAVRRRRCDIGIVSYPGRWPGVGVIPLRDEPMCVVCARSHPLAQELYVEARELGSYEMAAFEPALPVGRAVARYLRENGARPVVASVFDNIDTIKSAVAVTDQFAILPKRTAMLEVAAGTLAVVELEPELHRPLGVIYAKPNNGVHRGKRAGGLAGPVRDFVDYLIENAGPTSDLPARAEKRARETLATAKA